MKAQTLEKDFYRTFMSCAKEIRGYVRFHEKQDKDSMIKFSRSACLYQIIQYHEFTSLVIDSYFRSRGILIGQNSYRQRLECFGKEGMISSEDKNILLAISKVRNRLVHEPHMSNVEKLRLESKLIEYFKDEWFLHLVKYLYDTKDRSLEPMQIC